MTHRHSRSVLAVIVLGFGLAGAFLAARAGAQSGVIIEKRNIVTRGEHGPVPVPNPLRHVPDELLLRLKPGLTQAAAARALGAVALKGSRRFRSVEHLYHIKLASGVKLQQALRTFRRNPDVLYAEPNYVVEAFATPNDPGFPSQWSLANTGQTGGVPGADIGALGAWDATVGSAEVVIAINDTGVDYTHGDLAANMWQNPFDCNGDGVDSDGNGYVDDCHGINTLTSSGNPMDDNDHGTHVAGTIGAVGNNLYGVAGVAWNVKIIACKFLDASGSGDAAGAIACLDYLAGLKDRGVNIVASNNSWGGGLFSQALADAIARQQQRGILFIAAAGNSFADNDSLRTYPCTYELANIICVAATDDHDGLAYFSNYGRGTVHVGAPGVNILSTTIGDTLQTFSGTSMATPHVTGVAALLYAQNPTQDWRAVKNLILAGGEPRPALANTVTGRRLNAHGALTCAGSPVVSRVRPLGTQINVGVGAIVVVSALNINCAEPAGPMTVTVSPTGEVLTLLDDGQGSDQVADDGVYTAAWTAPPGDAFDLNFPDGSVVHVQVATRLKPGFPVQAFAGAGSYHGGPAIHVLVGNIDADPRLEILVTGLAQGPLHAWKSDGTPAPGWPALDPPGAAYPALGQLSLTDPGLEVFSGHFASPSRLGAHSGSGAALPGWPRNSANYVASPPSLASIDGSGFDTIFTEEEDWKLHAYRADGTILPGWPATTFVGGQERHTPAIADLDGDGIPEIVTASGSVSPGGVSLLAYRRNGTLVPGFPVSFNGHVDTYPVIGDVDGDGQLDIVVAGRVGSGDGVYIFSANGTLKRTMQASGSVYYGTALALADLDGDGIPEIIMQTNSAVNAWKGDGSIFPGWPVQVGPNTWLGNAGPVVGDVDGDGRPDIVVLAIQNSGNAGDVLVFHANGTLLPGFPIHLAGLGSGAVPAIADIDLDGRNDIIVASDFWSGVSGYYDKVWAYDLGGPTPHGPIQWGQFMGGPKHDGLYRAVQGTSVTLGVSRVGLGSGAVTSSPAGIDCGTDCSETYAVGTVVTLTAAADSGSTFTGWDGACIGQGNPCTLTMEGGRVAIAKFARPATLTVSTSGSGTGAVASNPSGITCGSDCIEDYLSGTTVSLTATASAGSIFSGWSGACAGTTNPCTVTMDGAKSVTASFGPAAMLTVAVAPSGSGTVRSNPAGVDCGSDCTETYPLGTGVTLTAYVSAGTVFTSWSGACAGQGNPCSLTMGADRSVTANFTPFYTMSVSRAGAGTGTVTSTPAGISCGFDCSEPYSSGTTVTLTAAANAGSAFVGWTGAACAAQGNPCTVTMTSNTFVTANFASTVTLSVSTIMAGNGVVTSNPSGINCGSDCSEPYPVGAVVTLTATPAAGYMFDGWETAPCSGQGTCTVTVTTNQTIVARFRQLFTVSLAIAGSGTGTVVSNPVGIACPGDCSEPFPSGGTSVTLTATPDAGSIFSSWSGDMCGGQGPTCQLVMGANYAITASFTRVYGLTVTRAGVGSGVVSSSPAGISCGTDCTETYNTGTTVTLTATAAVDSIFMGWSGGCTGATCTVTMTADRTAVATFAPNQPDLVETSVSDPPAAAAPGSTFNVTDTVLNQGGVSVASSTTRYYLSLDTVKDGTDRLLSGTRGVPTLAAGATSTGSRTVTIPSATPLGTYYFLACADDLAQRAERNEANNCVPSSGTIQVTRPDLLETAVSAPPATAVRGTSFSVTDTVLNQGALAAGTSTTRYYLSANPVKDGNDRLVGSRSVPALGASATSTGTASVAVPSNMSLGAYYLIACADNTTNVTESDETNNCLASDTSVQVTKP